jgi:hypothetical protein
MIKEVMQFSQIDPDVLEARSVARKLLGAFRICEDPLTKKALKGMVFDAFDFEAELELKARARDAIKMLNDLKRPEISKN